MIEVKIKKKNPEIPTPQYKTTGSAGCDICASENIIVPWGSSVLVPTGIFLEVPEGYECQVRPRSGLALKGITLMNSPGTVDSDFRGEMMILLVNHSNVNYSVNKGDRIAQLVFAPVTQATFEEVDELSETARGTGGWGSTGKS
jgi:dUTP diphosphatase